MAFVFFFGLAALDTVPANITARHTGTIKKEIDRRPNWDVIKQTSILKKDRSVRNR